MIDVTQLRFSPKRLPTYFSNTPTSSESLGTSTSLSEACEGMSTSKALGTAISTDEEPAIPNHPLPVSIFSLIHELHETVTRSIDSSLSWDQLNSPPINYTLIRPILDSLNPVNTGSERDKKPGGRKGGAGGGSLGVPDGIRSEEDGIYKNNHHRNGGEGENVERISLGMVLYALMANR